MLWVLYKKLIQKYCVIRSFVSCPCMPLTSNAPVPLTPFFVQDEPDIDEEYDGGDFTCITFKPDWKRFHMSGMEVDTIALLRKVCNIDKIWRG